MNSLVFLLIGLEAHLGALIHSWQPLLFAISAVLIGRAFALYLPVPARNLFAKRIPGRWQHVLVWDGLRGSLALASVLSLDGAFPYRQRLLDLVLGVVVFSILAKVLTIKPFLRLLGLADGDASAKLRA